MSHIRKPSGSSEDNELEILYATLEFKVNYTSKIGQILHICGNVQELGNWNADNSPKLRTNPTIYPNWESNFNFSLPIGMTIEYKYVLIDQNNNKVWEQLPNNSVRTLTMKKPGHYLIINEMGNLNLTIIDKTISSEIKTNSKISLNLIEKEDNEERKIKNIKFKFEDFSNVASELHPIDLISYENNKMSLDIFDDFDKKEIKLSSRDRIVMVTVYLPITVVKTKDGNYKIIESDNSFLFRYVNKLKTDVKKNYINVKWIGLLKNLYNFSEEEQEEIIDFLREYDYYPVSPSKKELNYFIYYLERVMYPVFLNSSFTPNDEIFADSKKYVDAFYNVNKEFVNKILSDCQDEDLITIHNIGLAFVADRLMHNKPNSHIGIYIHIDLPSSDVIKIFPYYQEIFRCFILCDVIGFHDFTSARNFLTIMRRFFGIFYNVSKKGLITLFRSGRTIIVHIKQPQLNYSYIEELTQSDEFKLYDQKYKKENEEFELSVTTFVYLYCLMAICTKIKAIELFLDSHKDLQNKASFRMWIKEFDNESIDNENKIDENLKENNDIKDSVDEEEEKRNKIKIKEIEEENKSKKKMREKFINYKKKITEMVNRLIKKYNNQKIIKIEYINDINDSQANNIFKRLALFKNTDIFLYPKFFFSQSLIVKEFISIQKDKNKNYGAIVSENMASLGIKSVISANPYDPEMISRAINKIYNMKFKQSRIDEDLKAIKKISLLE